MNVRKHMTPAFFIKVNNQPAIQEALGDDCVFKEDKQLVFNIFYIYIRGFTERQM